MAIRKNSEQIEDLADSLQTESTNRREALGLLGQYTAPAMLALLLSEQTAVASTTEE
jgi:hypothetical protein